MIGRLRLPGLRLLWGRFQPGERASTSTLSREVRASQRLSHGVRPRRTLGLTPSTQLAPSWLPPALDGVLSGKVVGSGHGGHLAGEVGLCSRFRRGVSRLLDNFNYWDVISCDC